MGRWEKLRAQARARLTVEYRDIAGYPGYRVGSDGTVLTSKRRNRPEHVAGWRPLRPCLRGGYSRVTLSRDGVGKSFTVSRLVLTAFVEPCPAGKEACHFPDNDRQNNWLWNLRWGTRKENRHDQEILGVAAKGSRSGCAKLTEQDIPAIRLLLASGETRRAIAAIYGVCHATINDVATGKQWRHIK